MTLDVDPMSAASPDMPTADADALRESIKRLGQLVPIVVSGGSVIDGRKRLRACRELGIEPKVLVIPDDATPAEFAFALNLLRTHYTEPQRAMYGSTLASLRKGQRPPEIPHPEISGGGETSKKSHGSRPLTQREAARRVGVTPSAISEAKNVRRTAAPEVTAAVEQGAISLYAAKKIAERPQDEQAPLLAKALAAKGDGKKMKPGTLVSRKGYRRRKVAKVLPRVLAALGDNADLLAEYLEENPPVPPGPRADWLQALDNVAKVISRCKRWLKQEEEAA